MGKRPDRTLSTRPPALISFFVKVLDGLIAEKDRSLADLIEHILNKTGFLESASEEGVNNLKELTAMAGRKGLDEFLDEATLFTGMDETFEDNAVALMTLHNAKGLEFL